VSSDKKTSTSSGNTSGNPALKGTTSRICTFHLNNSGESKVTIKTSCADHKSYWQATMDSMFGPTAAELSALSPGYKLLRYHFVWDQPFGVHAWVVSPLAFGNLDKRIFHRDHPHTAKLQWRLYNNFDIQQSRQQTWTDLGFSNPNPIRHFIFKSKSENTPF